MCRKMVVDGATLIIIGSYFKVHTYNRSPLVLIFYRKKKTLLRQVFFFPKKENFTIITIQNNVKNVTLQPINYT
jgi:cytochrome c oxidase subunit IV